MSMKSALHIVMFVWQLPQNLLGLLFLAFLHPCKIVRTEDYAVVRTSRKMRGGISLGHYVFLSLYQCTGITINHELGHCRQSMMLGPLYLLVIGLPSIIWAWLGDRIAPDRSYYWFYTERWADRLGGVERMEYY